MPAYLSGWDNRAKIVIDHTKIDAALVDFPVAIPISASCGQGDQDLSAVFDELESDANRTKIAVTTDDGQTQCYVEIENWDDASETAILHVKVPAISADEDTILYLYFDDEQAANTDFVGDPGDAIAANVWDDDFKLVYHMAEDPNGDGADAIKDSTSNNNDGTPAGTMLTEDLVDGLNGAKAIDFDGSNDLVNAGSDASLGDLDPIFIETVLNADTFGGGDTGRIVDKSAGSTNGFLFYISDANDQLAISFETDGDDGRWTTPTDSFEAEINYYTAVHVDRSVVPASVVDAVFYINDTIPVVSELITPSGNWSSDVGSDLCLGNRSAAERGFDGPISEFRISNVDRGAAWAKATYHTLFDTLITWQTVDFDNRFKITIDHNFIDADLTDFPVMIKISDDSGKGGADLTAIFDELVTDAERVKIAVTTSDGETQCPVEIEYWDVASELAILHVKVPAVDDDISTVLYLHYDAAVPDNTLFVGDTGDAVAQDVWDSNFAAVYHCSQDPDVENLLDSTGTLDLVFANCGAANLVAGKHGKAFETNGTDEWATAGSSVLSDEIFTIELLGVAEDVTTSGPAASVSGKVDDFNVAWLYQAGTLEGPRGGYNSGTWRMTDGAAISNNEWFYAAFTSASGGVSRKITQGDDIWRGEVDENTVSDNFPTCTETTIGGINRSGVLYAAGIHDEVRFSDIVRSDAWLKATYYNLYEDLLSFGLSNGYLPGFKNRVQIDIDSSLIDADLTDFPVTLHLSEAAGISGLDMRRVFEVIQTSGDNKKIAVTTADGLTQCSVEIEAWSHADKTAVLHVKVPHVESSADTVLYLYFDNSAADNDSFVGDTGDTPALEVWDDNFVGVYHLAQDPTGGADCILDSTANGNTMTPNGSMTAGDLIDSQPGKGLDFDGSDDHVTRTTALLTAFPGTMEAAGPVSVSAGAPTSPSCCLADNSDGSQFTTLHIHDGYGRVMFTHAYSNKGTVLLVEDEFCHLAATFIDATDRNVFTNGADKTQDTISQAFPTGLDRTSIGSAQDSTPDYFPGETSEVRFSDIVRADAWILATYHTLADTLVTFSNFESTEFKKRRKVTIDSSLIDEPLVDFPIALPLGASAGIGDEDLSDIFAELKFPASDPFYAGIAFDTTRWEQMGTAANVTMVDNTLQCHADSSDGDGVRQGVLSLFTLDYTQDFDVRVDFEITAGPSTNGWYVDLEAYFFDPVAPALGGIPWDTGVMVRKRYDTTNSHSFGTVGQEDSVGKTTQHVASSATKGSLRLVYNAAAPSITPYYKAEGDWIALNAFSYTDMDATDARICINIATTGSKPTATVKFTNFDIYEGVVKWPAGEPNRKKLKVTLDDLITECPVEIEHLDVDGQVGILHTKIPYISAAEDTEIYLHYDCDQPDNSNVGDTGDVIAQTVWDEYFEAVWHLAQDPSGGASCILDSTDNGNDGTPEGTMLTEDLVTMDNNSQGIDFDGSDDSIDVGIINVTSITIEALIDTSYTSDVQLIVGKDNTADYSPYRRSFQFRIDADGTLRFIVFTDPTTLAQATSAATGYNDGELHHIAGTFDQLNAYTFADSVKGSAAALVGALASAENEIFIGKCGNTGPAYTDGIIGEVRLSDVARSDAWLKATYHTLFDTLLTWSDPDRAAPWLGTWAYRRKFTISEALVDAELVDFPIALPIDASCGIGADDLSGLFSLISTANKKKMAITLGDKVTECYFELENWDSVNSKGIIHTRGPIIQLGKDTELYIYYDSDQDENARAGVPGDAIAANVWDDYFMAVYHLAEDPSGGAGAMKDSTVNDLDGTSSGTMLTEDLVDGQVGGVKGIDFDGTDDYIDCGGAPVTDDPTLYTMEGIFKADTYGENYNGRIFCKAAVADGPNMILEGHAPKAEIGLYRDTSGGVGKGYWTTPQDSILLSTWYHCAITHDIASIDNDPDLFINGVGKVKTEVSTPGGTWDSDAAGELWIGARNNSGSPDREFNGIISEIRYSNALRSDAWLKATHHVLFDTFGTWGSEEEIISESDDLIIILGAPAEITLSVPASLVGIGVDMAAPAEITYSVPEGLAGIGADVGTPEITYSVPAATIVQNLNAIGIMSKPNVSAKKPSATVTARRPSATATGSGPSATVTAKGD